MAGQREQEDQRFKALLPILEEKEVEVFGDPWARWSLDWEKTREVILDQVIPRWILKQSNFISPVIATPSGKKLPALEAGKLVIMDHYR